LSQRSHKFFPEKNVFFETKREAEIIFVSAHQTIQQTYVRTACATQVFDEAVYDFAIWTCCNAVDKNKHFAASCTEFAPVDASVPPEGVLCR